MFIPPLAIAVSPSIIIPAVNTPATITGTAFFGSRSKKFAISEPIHAPVPGTGIATNRNTPNSVAFFSFSLSAIFLVAFSVAQSIIFFNILIFPNKLNIGLMNFTMKYTGKIFPIKLMANASKYDKWNVSTPIGIAPLSSIIGTILTINVTK